MIDHPIWEGIQHHVMRNLPEYMTFVGALAIAAVCTIPAKIPASIQEWWDWMRNTLQTAVPAARSHQQPPNPTPDNPAQEKKA